MWSGLLWRLLLLLHVDLVRRLLLVVGRLLERRQHDVLLQHVLLLGQLEQEGVRLVRGCELHLLLVGRLLGVGGPVQVHLLHLLLCNEQGIRQLMS